MTVAGLAGQNDRWKKDIILTTVVCVLIALAGIALGTAWPRQNHRASLANSRIVYCCIVFCYFAAVMPSEICSSHQLRASTLFFRAFLWDHRDLVLHPVCPSPWTGFNIPSDLSGRSCSLPLPAEPFRMAQHCIQFRNCEAVRK
jgi:hypothetical protein